MHEFDKCLVTRVVGSGLLEGSVFEFEDGRMTLTLSGEVSLVPGEKVSVFVYNEVRGECLYSAVVESVGGAKTALSEVAFVRATQKRDNTRVEKTLRYRITHCYIESGDGKNVEKLEKPVNITIYNISANGMFIGCEESFKKGFRFPFVFREAGAPISLEVEVIRCEHLRHGSKYGCRFVGISERDADNIYRFVLHEQIEQRRRKILF